MGSYEDMGNFKRYYDMSTHVYGHDTDDEMTPEKEMIVKKYNREGDYEVFPIGPMKNLV